MPLRFVLSLRDRHPLAPLAIALLGQHLVPVHLTPRLASLGALWLALPCLALWLVGCVTWAYLFGGHPSAPRIRVRDIDLGEQLVTLRLPARRPSALPRSEGWTRTAWSADDVAPWSPQRDER